MKKTLKASIIAVSAFIIAMLAVNLAFAATTTATRSLPTATSKTAQVMAANGLNISPEQIKDPEQLKKNPSHARSSRKQHLPHKNPIPAIHP